MTDMKNIWIFSLIVFYSLLGYGQSYKFYTTDKELSSSLINQIYQDKDGVIWVATEYGLNRYDGVKFTIYKHDIDNPHSLMNNYVKNIFETSNGDLIICTFSGIQKYNPLTDDFSLPARTVVDETFVNVVGSVMERKNGEIWIASPTPGKLIVKDDELVVDFLDLPIPDNHFPDQYVEDKEGNIWIAVSGVGVYRITPENEVTLYLKNIHKLHALCLCKDNDGNLFVGSLGQGLYRYNVQLDDFEHISYNSEALPVKFLMEKSPNEIYIGTDGQGIKVYDKKKNTIVDYSIEFYYLNLNKSKVHTMWTDKDGSLWIGLYQKGILYQPVNTNNFKYLGPKSIYKNIIGDCCITSILKDRDGFLWVGSDNDGIYRISKDKNHSLHYSMTGNQKTLSGAILSLFEDSKSNLWFGSYTKGVGKIDKRTGRCILFGQLKSNDGNPIPAVFAFAEDKEGRLWIGATDGLYCYDLNSGQLKLFSEMSGKVIAWINCLHYSSSKNKLFVGSYGGLDCVDLDSGIFSSKKIISTNAVHSICEDKNGIIWTGTSEGIYSFDVKHEKVESYTVKDGLPSDVIYAIQCDDNNRLWISTNSGVSCFHLHDKQFVNYYVSDGLQGNEFYKNSSYKDSDGIIYFGGMNGLTYFKPREIFSPNKKWNVRISDFYVFDKTVRTGIRSGGKEIIDRSIFEATDFYLSYKDNTFSLEFSTVELNKPERLVYVYSFNNGDWINLPHGINRVSFSNLTPGEYTFRIKVKDGMMESDVRECTIHISSPWWATVWAKISYFVLALIIIGVGIYRFKRHLHYKKERIEHLHAVEINNAKLQFFINIAHEIRTPLSLVVSPLLGLMKTDKDESRQKIYKTIYRNTQRLLLLVNQLMDIRKIEKNQMKLTFQKIDIVHYIRQICESFSIQASVKNIALNFNTHGCENLDLWVDPAYFDKIIINILSNAFKFTKEGSIDIDLFIAGQQEGAVSVAQYAKIQITDTGIGIDEKEYEHIFERFYQVHNNLSTAGTGIGLHLAQSLVKLHHGEISVGRNVNGLNGTTFTIEIPLGDSHLSQDEICGEIEKGETIISPATDMEVPLLENPDPEKNLHVRRKWKVCIVEDDDEIRKYIKDELSVAYHITEYNNGKEAWSGILKEIPNLIISDVMMPEMDGFTLCEKIKQNVNLNYLPVILLTAKTTDESTIKGLDIGADAYITKPFNIAILHKTVENLILKHQKMQNIFTGRQGQDDKLDKLEAKSPDEKLMERIMKVINDNLSNPELTVDVIVNEVGISRAHLHRKLKELTNQPTRQFIRNIRLKQAAQLLSEKRHSIAEVAQMTGFSNPNNFSTLFKELYGVTPSEYMEQHLQENK